MDCTHVQEAILDAFDETGANAARQRTIDAHVASCPACAAFAARQRELDARLAALIASPALSPAFRAGLRQRMQHEPQPASRRWTGWIEAVPDILHLAGWSAATATAVMLLPFDARAIVGVGAMAAAGTYLLLTAVRETLEGVS